MPQPLEQFQKLLGASGSGTSSSLAERGIDRYEVSSIPAQSSQKNWRYSLVKGGDDSRLIHLDGGNGRTFAFRFDGAPTADQFSSGEPVPLTRLGDSTRHSKGSDGEVVSKGVIQVHRSTPTMIHATLQDGKGNSTVMFEQAGGNWTMRGTPKRKRLSEVAGKFVGELSKQAGVEPDTSIFGRYLASKNLDISIAQNKRQIMDEIDPDGTLQESQTLLDLESYKKQRQLGYDFLKKTLRRQSSGSILGNALAYGALGGAVGAARGAMSGRGTSEGPGFRAVIGGGIGLAAGALAGSLGRLWNKYEERKITDEDVARMKEQQKDRSLASDFIPGLDIYDAVMTGPKRDKLASVCCPCCGVKPGKYKIQGDAISCGECGKTSDMERWEKQADTPLENVAAMKAFGTAPSIAGMRGYGPGSYPVSQVPRFIGKRITGMRPGSPSQPVRTSTIPQPHLISTAPLKQVAPLPLGHVDKTASNESGDKVIAVDLDGTLAERFKGEFDPKVIGAPIASMRRMVRMWTRKGHEVRIFTARAADPKNIPPIKAWLKEHGMEGLKITNEKTPDIDTFVDDKAVAVIPDTGRSCHRKLSALVARFATGQTTGQKETTTLGETAGQMTGQNNDHCTKNTCPQCGDVQTCRCSKPITNFTKELCYHCQHPKDCRKQVTGQKEAGVTSYLKILRDKFTAARKTVNLAPTKPQQEAGNYSKGHVWMQGFDITIENPKGSSRSGTCPDGTTWKTTLAADYGDIRNYPRSKADGDNMDVFVGPHPSSEIAYVIDQYIDKKFDEHKIVLGCFTEKEAKAIYQDSFDDQWEGMGDVTTLTIRQLKSWLKDGDTSKPLAGQDLSDFVKTAMAELDHEEKLAADNSYLPPFLASVADSRWVKEPGLAIGTGAARGALVAALIHGARTLKREGLDEPKRDLNLTRDLLLGTAIGAGSGALLHYTPEIMEFGHKILAPAKLAHAMDIPLAPLHIGGGAAPLIGAGYGAIVGAIKGVGGKIKRKLTGEPEEDQFTDDVLNAAQSGLNIGSMAALSGMNPASTPVLKAMGVRSDTKRRPPPPSPVARLKTRHTFRYR